MNRYLVFIGDIRVTIEANERAEGYEELTFFKDKKIIAQFNKWDYWFRVEEGVNEIK